MSNTVFCIARSPAQATHTIDVLLCDGFAVEDVSALYRRGLMLDDALEQRGLATQTLPAAPSSDISLSWTSAGPLANAFSDMADASLGMLTQRLTELGVPHFEASLYAKKIDESNFLLAIHTDELPDAQRALSMLMDNAGAAYTCLVVRHDHADPQRAHPSDAVANGGTIAQWRHCPLRFSSVWISSLSASKSTGLTK